MEEVPNTPGNPQQLNQPQPPLQAPPVNPYANPAYRPRRKALLESLVDNNKLAGIIVVGMLLVMIGLMMVHAAPGITNYGSNPPKADRMADDRALQTSVIIWGHIITDLGMIGISTFLLVASIYRKDMETKVRLGLLLLAAILIIITWMRLVE